MRLSLSFMPGSSLVLALLCGAAAWAQVPVPGPLLSTPRFQEETDTAGLQSRFEGEGEYMVGGGVATFDCDGDGLPEVYVTAGVNKAKFYRNRSARGGALKLLEERSGLELTNAVGAYPLDVDGDGQTDLVVLRVGEVQVYKGLGQCKFERANEAWNIRTGNGWHTAFSATWEAGQSWPTLAFGTYTDRSKLDFPWGSCTPGLLLRPREGGGYSPPQPLHPGHCALSMLFSDWNRSGTAALRVSNDREYYKGGEEQLWQLPPGQAPALYTAAQGWRPLQIWGMGIASHDLTGDGYPEVFLTSMSDNKLQTLEAGAQQPRYTDIAYKRGVTAHRPYVGGDVHPSTAWHAQFADLNNDGLVDLFIAKGNVSTMPDFATLDPNNLLLQKADGNFTEVGSQAGLASFKRGRGGMVVDLNGDGLLDVLVVNRWDKAQVWRQLPAATAGSPVSTGHWLQLRLSQAAGNRDAVGAWVELRWGEGDAARVIRQELTVGGGHASGHLGWMHFGVDDATRVQVRVQWPHGAWSEWASADADAFYQYSEAGLRPVKQP
ncbi:MAG: CRTAC1 family protein [Rhodoferax sp.]|uniref:CRTAC1 family protein n=1 Tax=Rhodoferax sp. TaxID=50421 RepID=UPI002ACE07CD|nr:CRTAC1 family protein [Rhodoferax sp.]MDZ7891237.1 CRTAC1 family protein [Rhodoferax sp.]